MSTENEMLDPDVLTDTQPRLELVRRLFMLSEGRELLRLLSDHDEEVRARHRAKLADERED